jgi:hypothetical protein
MKIVKQNNETPSFPTPLVDFALGVADVGDEVEEGLELTLGDEIGADPGDETGDDEGGDDSGSEGASEGGATGSK